MLWLFAMLVAMAGLCSCGGGGGGGSTSTTSPAPEVAALPTVTTATGTITTVGTTTVERSLEGSAVGTTETVTIKCDSTPATTIDSNFIFTVTKTENVAAPINGTVKIGETAITASTVGTVLTITITTPKPITGTSEIIKDINGYTTIILTRQV